MPSTDVMWQMAASVYVLLVTGGAFVAWHSPAYFARIWLNLMPVMIGATILIFGYQIGIWVASAHLTTTAQPANRQFANTVIAAISVPVWVPWALAFISWPMLVLSKIARHRSEEQRRGK